MSQVIDSPTAQASLPLRVQPTEEIAPPRALERPILLVCLTLVVVIVYAFPLVAAHALEHKLLYAETPDDSFYSTRVLELIRGGALGNPYLPEHQNAPRYMPELIEHVLAFSIRTVGMAPLQLIAVTRVILPVLIFLLVYRLGIALNMEVPFALLTGCFTVFAPSLSLGGYTLRYFRVISPAAYVLLVIIALIFLRRVWLHPSWPSICLAGGAVGLLLYTPVYYWSFVLLGLGLLALLSPRPLRVALIASAAMALVIGGAGVVHSARISADPVVKETLARLSLMVPGRHLEPGVLPRLLIALLTTGIAWWFRKKQMTWARFIFPFGVAVCFMLVQNVATNRQFQAYHMVNCLMPLAAVVLAGFLQGYKVRQPCCWAAIILLIAAGTIAQISGYREWSRNIKACPAQYALDTGFPDTIAWLNSHTSAQSVVVFPEDMASAAPLFTRNGVYLGRYVYQYVLSNDELQSRREARRSWVPGKSFPYRADLVVGLGDACQQGDSAMAAFRDFGEGTCIFAAGR